MMLIVIVRPLHQSRVIFQQPGERSFHSFYQVNMFVSNFVFLCVCPVCACMAVVLSLSIHS